MPVWTHLATRRNSYTSQGGIWQFHIPEGNLPHQYRTALLYRALHPCICGDPFRWYYQFGDGYSSTSKDPVHTYRNPGTYTVTLSVMKVVNTKLITTTTEKVGYITVKGTPESQLAASFTASPVTGEAPLMVSFTDTSTGNPTGYCYSFGDLSVSSGPDPFHTYRRPGTYDVQLTVWSTAGGDLKSNTTVCRDCITVT
jgi:PKD repeat protein